MKQMTKRLFSLVLACALLLGTVGVLADTTYLGLATGSVSGTYYPLGGDIASLWMKKIAGLDVTTQSTGGSKKNILLIDEGGAEIATAQNDVCYYAYKGDQDFFEGKVISSFAAIGTLYPELVQIVVAADSGIKSVSDLKGKAVGIGAIGSGAYFNAIQILAEAGLSLDDINEQHLSFDESSTAFQNKQVDAFFITAGVPNTAIIEVANKRNINLITLNAEQMAALQAKYSFYVPVTVPKGTYNGMEEDVIVPAVKATLICKKDLPEDLVYQMTKVLYEDTAELSHAKKADISAENGVQGVPVEVPFHPGALKFFTEKGLIK